MSVESDTGYDDDEDGQFIKFAGTSINGNMEMDWNAELIFLWKTPPPTLQS